MSHWNDEKEQRRIARDTEKMRRALASPVARGEVASGFTQLQQHVISVALGLEALDSLLIAKGILRDNELMDAIGELVKAKAEQARAADVSTEPVDAPLVELTDAHMDWRDINCP